MELKNIFTESNIRYLLISELKGLALFIVSFVIVYWQITASTNIVVSVFIVFVVVTLIGFGLHAFANAPYIHLEIAEWGIHIRHGAFGLWHNNIAMNDILSIRVTSMDKIKEKVAMIHHFVIINNKDIVRGFVSRDARCALVILTEFGTFIYASKFIEVAATRIKEMHPGVVLSDI